ncbi:pilus assembly protein [Tropicimonas sp. IMCC6043]|nr:pilus assembly protein [Tropicimonas sp. IMCC6043]
MYTRKRRGRTNLSAFRRFRRDESGGMIIFTLYILLCMLLAIGLSLDTVRFEYTRAKLQHTLDRAVLAAANLEQVLDPKDVVEDYFAKAGLADNLVSVNVEQGINYRTVSARSEARIDTMFIDMVGIKSLTVPASGAANESLADIEIALVLDNSGSMREGTPTRLQLLKDAANEFIDAVARDEADQDGTTAISIVPFSEQVSLGETMFNQYSTTSEQDRTRCVTFTESQFSSVSLPPTEPLLRTMHFDAQNSQWYVSDAVCDTSGDRDIAAWSTDPDYLKSRINAMQHGGWTSIDVGTKWGVTMLDPVSQPVLSALIDAGEVDKSLEGQPFAYDRDNTKKVLVVMSDGANTVQREVRPGYREGNSPLYLYRYYGRDYYSYYHDRPGTSYDYYSHYHKAWRRDPVGGNDADRLTWPEVWADMSVIRYAYEFPSRIFGGSYWTYYDQMVEEIGSKTATAWDGNVKNPRTSAICDAAKQAGILIFTIGMDTDDPAADMALEDCASLPTYYYDVRSLDISNAFASIALQINQLRLTQ